MPIGGKSRDGILCAQNNRMSPLLLKHADLCLAANPVSDFWIIVDELIHN